MMVDHALRIVGGAGGIAERDRVPFVEHGERRLGDVWTLEGMRAEECTLVVYPASPSRSEVTMEFAYNSEHDAFVFEGGLAHMVLAPRDFDFSGYLAKR